MSRILLSSKTDDWLTPPDVLERIRAVMPIAFDPCGHALSFVAPLYPIETFAQGVDGLEQDWLCCHDKPCADCLTYVNPPYSDLAAWLTKCTLEDARGVPVAALVPFRAETVAFQDEVLGRAWVFAFRGRLTFWRDIAIEYAEVEARNPNRANLRRLEAIADAAAGGARVFKGDSATFSSALCVWPSAMVGREDAWAEAFPESIGRWLR